MIVAVVVMVMVILVVKIGVNMVVMVVIGEVVMDSCSSGGDDDRGGEVRDS